jgi:DNA-binding transcriptional MerR regulator
MENNEPLLDPELIGKLIVSIGDVSNITNIPIRQIRYWEEKGIIQSEAEAEGKTRRYNYANIKKILLIKELLDEGYTLEASARKVEDRIRLINEAFEKLKGK